MRIYRTVIVHPHGRDVFHSKSFHGAYAHVVAFARDWWTHDRPNRQLTPDNHAKLDDKSVVEAYFDTNGLHSYDIEQVGAA